MIIISGSQAKQLFQESLQRSGYGNLNQRTHLLWEKMWKRGFYSLLPGFFGRLLEKLTGNTSGEGQTGINSWQPEDRFFRLEVWEKLRSRISRNSKENEHQSDLAGFLHRLLQLTHSGLSEVFQWGDFESLSDVSDERSLSNLIWEEEERRLNEYSKKPWFSGPQDELPLFEEQLFPNAKLIHIHRWWEYNFQHFLGQISVQSMQDYGGSYLIEDKAEALQLMGGYSDIEIKGEGSWTALVPSELVYRDDSIDCDLFDAKMAQNELLFFRRDEGAERVLQRRVIVTITAPQYKESIRALARLMAWIELVWQMATKLYQKDKMEWEVLLRIGDSIKERGLLDILAFRINRSTPHPYHLFLRYPVGKKEKGHRITTTLSPGTLDFEMKDGVLFERHFLANLQNIYETLRWRRHGSVSA